MHEMQSELLERVRALVGQATTNEGCLLYDLEFTSGQNGRVLRVFIERDPGPVNLEDCANVSRQLNSLLDEYESLIPGGGYDLEVSSPGVERQLRAPWHFERAVGKPVRVKTQEPTNGGLEGVSPQTLLDGTLLKFENDSLTILKDQREWQVPLAVVGKAQVRLETPASHPKGKKRGK